MRQFIDADEQKFRALILVDVVLVSAVAEARCGTVCPGDQMLRFVVARVHRARNIAPEVCE